MLEYSDKWTAVDVLCESLLAPVPRSVSTAEARCVALGLPPISVTPAMGRLLMILARLAGARRVLEIGTLGGYSTAWLAEALMPGGCVLTIEIDPVRAEAARETFRQAGISDRVEVRCGTGEAELCRLIEAKAEPFDLVFVDADKESSAAYFDLALGLTRVGGLIVIDNVIREGNILDAAHADPRARGSRAAIERVGASRGTFASVLQTVGSKGHDGFAIALVGEASARRG
jgi:predicted O-methyltransferase YrrM